MFTIANAVGLGTATIAMMAVAAPAHPVLAQEAEVRADDGQPGHGVRGHVLSFGREAGTRIERACGSAESR